jgi:predicted nucleotidyltransferase
LREDFNDSSDIAILVSFADTASITFFELDTIEQQLSKIFHRLDVVTKREIAPKPQLDT